MSFRDVSLVVFDLDGTLAESKSPLSPAMAGLLDRLLGKLAVSVISGGRFSQFEKQFVAGLPDGADLSRLYLFPTCGAAFYRFSFGQWTEVYSESLSPEDKSRIFTALHRALAIFGHHPEKVWGEMIEDRGSQITFSALGQQAPLVAKSSWDPDQEKRRRIISILMEDIPDFDIKYGGTSSIDITRKGVDKAYGIRKMESHLGIGRARMLFIGDRLEPGGNDHSIVATGVRFRAVTGPAETMLVINEILGQNS